jgi:hypothetical protein
VRVIERCDGENGELGLELFDSSTRATELEVLVGYVFVVSGPISANGAHVTPREVPTVLGFGGPSTLRAVSRDITIRRWRVITTCRLLRCYVSRR